MNRLMALSCAAVAGAALLAAGDASAVKFRFPVVDTERIQFDYVIGCDHDPYAGEYSFDCLPWCFGMSEYPDCETAVGFPYCYDAHEGTDFMLIDGFAMMDAGSADVVAAAPGTVISVEDDNYDRCHANILTQEIDCDGHLMVGNHVKIRHEDGSETWYWHFMKDSIVVQVDDVVSCGEVLGKIGSSGYSSGPHLHFEVRVPDGMGGTTWVDPYAGLNSQDESYWVLQRDPTTLLPGCYCEGDEIPDFPEPSEDTGPGQDVIVVQDVYEDVPPDAGPDVIHDVMVDAPDDVPATDVTGWEAWDADSGSETTVFDVTGDTPVTSDVSGDAVIRDMSGQDQANADTAASVDSGTGGQDVNDGAGGCSSSGSAGASVNGLMLLLAAGILALARRRGRAIR